MVSGGGWRGAAPWRVNGVNIPGDARDLAKKVVPVHGWLSSSWGLAAFFHSSTRKKLWPFASSPIVMRHFPTSAADFGPFATFIGVNKANRGL